MEKKKEDPKPEVIRGSLRGTARPEGARTLEKARLEKEAKLKKAGN